MHLHLWSVCFIPFDMFYKVTQKTICVLDFSTRDSVYTTAGAATCGGGVLLMMIWESSYYLGPIPCIPVSLHAQV